MLAVPPTILLDAATPNVKILLHLWLGNDGGCSSSHRPRIYARDVRLHVCGTDRIAGGLAGRVGIQRQCSPNRNHGRDITNPLKVNSLAIPAATYSFGGTTRRTGRNYERPRVTCIGLRLRILEEGGIGSIKVAECRWALRVESPTDNLPNRSDFRGLKNA